MIQRSNSDEDGVGHRPSFWGHLASLTRAFKGLSDGRLRASVCLDTGSDVQMFISNFTGRYGRRHPIFFGGTYNQARQLYASHCKQNLIEFLPTHFGCMDLVESIDGEFHAKI